MSASQRHRAALLETAVRLFRQQGYAGTGINEILAASGAPRGSLYHYFPNGKAEIGAEAVRLAGAKVTATLQQLAAEANEPGAILTRYLTLLAGWMQQSDYRDGSPITTTLLETVPEHAAIRAAGTAAFTAWATIIETAAVASGIAPDRAPRLSRFAIAVLEGALIQCRVAGNDAPLLDAAAELRELFAAARGTTLERR